VDHKIELYDHTHLEAPISFIGGLLCSAFFGGAILGAFAILKNLRRASMLQEHQPEAHR
jgi:hypothetical protein